MPAISETSGASDKVRSIDVSRHMFVAGSGRDAIGRNDKSTRSGAGCETMLSPARRQLAHDEGAGRYLPAK